MVALSGGLDSMNLYELLYKNKERLKIHLVLAHVNHGQRPESDLEESELRTLADRRWGVNRSCFSQNSKNRFSIISIPHRYLLKCWKSYHNTMINGLRVTFQ